MVGLLIIGLIFVALGTYATVKGKIPLLKHYEGVKNITLHSRINGSAIIAIGVVLLSFYFVEFNSIMLITAFLVIAVLALTLQIILRAI